MLHQNIIFRSGLCAHVHNVFRRGRVTKNLIKQIFKKDMNYEYSLFTFENINRL